MNTVKHDVLVRLESGREALKKRLKDLPDGEILIIPFEEEEEPREVRTRKRLYSYGQRAAALMR